MVNRIPENNPNGYRVDEAKEALDDEGQKGGGQEDSDDQNGDHFDTLGNKTDWHILFDKNDLWQRNVEVKVEDIDRIKFLGVNLKTNPALLKIRVFLFDGTQIQTAFLSIPRHTGMNIRQKLIGPYLDVNLLTKDPVLRLTVPADEESLDEEITKITEKEAKEHTLSKTVKMWTSHRTFLHRLGIVDPVSKDVNKEMVAIYLLGLLVLIALGLIFYVVFS